MKKLLSMVVIFAWYLFWGLVEARKLEVRQTVIRKMKS